MVESVKIPPLRILPGTSSFCFFLSCSQVVLNSQDLGDNHQEKVIFQGLKFGSLASPNLGLENIPGKNVRCIPLWTWLSHRKYPKRNIYKFTVLQNVSALPETNSSPQFQGRNVSFRVIPIKLGSLSSSM